MKYFVKMYFLFSNIIYYISIQSAEGETGVLLEWASSFELKSICEVFLECLHGLLNLCNFQEVLKELWSIEEVLGAFKML
jgi:hypothetical protein